MNTTTQERRQTFIFRLAFTSTLLMSIVVLALVGLQVWVRWTMNKDFSFLGGFQLETLTASVVVLIVGMLYVYRTEQK